MKAICIHEFGPPEVMKFEEVPDPTAGVGQVLVRIEAAGVNPVDTYIRSGAYANKPPLPFTPGTDAAGVVERVGNGVSHVRAGDRVYTTGTLTGAYAELALCSADQIYMLPEQVNFQQGAALFVPYTTAYRALFQRISVRAGQTVLIHGATGGVGTAATQFAVAAGLTVIGTGGTDEGRAHVRAQGAAHVLDHKSSGYLEEIMKITAGRGVDVVLEMLANVNLGKDLTVLARDGVIVVIGNRGAIEINPRELMRTEGTIVGVMGLRPPHIAEAQAAIGAGLRAGTLRPIVGKRLPLKDAALAHHQIMETRALGKMVLTVATDGSQTAAK